MSPPIRRARPRALGPLTAAVLAAVTVSVSLPAPASAAFGDHPLRRGAQGHEVRVLQSWLTRVQAPTTVDGVFGRLTERRVRGFERRQGRRIDGRVSVADARVLRRLVEGDRGSAPRSVEGVADPDAGAAAGAGVATLNADGRTATAPEGAPAAVVAAVEAANALTRKPYVYGGGHGRWVDRGYDCSGAVSYVLHGAGLLDVTLDSSGLAAWGAGGAGEWISVYGHKTHAYMVIAGLRFDTSGAGEDGPRWRPQERSSAGFAVRHPAGL